MQTTQTKRQTMETTRQTMQPTRQTANLANFNVLATRLQGYKATRLQDYKVTRLRGYKANCANCKATVVCNSGYEG